MPINVSFPNSSSASFADFAGNTITLTGVLIGDMNAVDFIF